MSGPVCKWLSDSFSEICCNGECPACADFCPALDPYAQELAGLEREE